MNGFCAVVCWPGPAQIHDSKLVYNSRNPTTKKYNFQLLNEHFKKDDTAITDCSFSMFTPRGAKHSLLKSTVVTRIRKEKKKEFLPITKAINEQLSQDRNGIEQNFGWIKCKFNNISEDKHKFVHNGKSRCAYSIIANEFALNNIHCFEELLVKNNLLKEIDLKDITNHPQHPQKVIKRSLSIENPSQDYGRGKRKKSLPNYSYLNSEDDDL